MKRFLSMSAVLTAALAALTVSPATAQQAGSKLAYVNFQKILASAPGATQAQQTLDSEMQKYQVGGEVGVMPCTCMSMLSDKLIPAACETDIAGWIRLDEHEMALGEPHGRTRVKVVPRDEMISISRDER